MTNGAKRVVIVGATSAIAEATARIWATQGARLVLVGRDEDCLDAIAMDLKIRGAAEAAVVVLDCSKANAKAELDAMVKRLGGLDILLLAYGALGDQRQLEVDPAALTEFIQTNFASGVAWSLAASAILEKQRSGALIVIGSVAGDRGRRSNFIYGACKGGLAHLVEGIAHKLAAVGARAVIIKPGFVDTPMTASFDKKGLLWAKPDAVASIIAGAAEKGGPVIYAPAWGLIMLITAREPEIEAAALPGLGARRRRASVKTMSDYGMPLERLDHWLKERICARVERARAVCACR